MKTDSKIILAIETAIEGGSLSLLRDDVEITSWTGTQQVSKAEDILEKISDLLNAQKIKKSDVTFIAVSNGPGSSTGIKIGLAIAKGLGKSLNLPVKEISMFDALLEGSDDFSNRVTIAVLPIGKNLLCRQIFDNGNASGINEFENPKTLSVEEFRIELVKTAPAQIVFHKKAYHNCKTLFTDGKLNKKSYVIESNLAYLTGKTCYKFLRVR